MKKKMKNIILAALKTFHSVSFIDNLTLWCILSTEWTNFDNKGHFKRNQNWNLSPSVLASKQTIWFLGCWNNAFWLNSEHFCLEGLKEFSLFFLHFYARLGAGEGLPGACDANPKMNTPTLAGVTITPPPSSPHCPILLGPWTAPGPPRWEHRRCEDPPAWQLPHLSVDTSPPLSWRSSSQRLFFFSIWNELFIILADWRFLPTICELLIPCVVQTH